MLARGGRQAHVEADAAVAPGLLAEFLAGPVLAVLMEQRGAFVLHASAVEIDGAAVAFVAASGGGKSTTAGFFAARGHAVATDDLLPLFVSGPQDPVRPGTTDAEAHGAGGRCPVRAGAGGATDGQATAISDTEPGIRRHATGVDDLRSRNRVHSRGSAARGTGHAGDAAQECVLPGRHRAGEAPASSRAVCSHRRACAGAGAGASPGSSGGPGRWWTSSWPTWGRRARGPPARRPDSPAFSVVGHRGRRSRRRRTVGGGLPAVSATMEPRAARWHRPAAAAQFWKPPCPFVPQLSPSVSASSSVGHSSSPSRRRRPARFARGRERDGSRSGLPRRSPTTSRSRHWSSRSIRSRAQNSR